MADLCPVATVYPDINLANHLQCIQYANLGPADPREPSTEYWMLKQEKWGVTEGLARTRLCMNCAHYKNDPETQDCIIEGPGGQIKPSALPVTPRWADIEGMPSAVCTRWNITCSALRTCDDWEDPNTDSDNANVWFVTPEEDDTEEMSFNGENYKALNNHKPTTGMAAAARRALAWRKDGNRGGTTIGVARANQLVNRETLSDSTVMRMHSFFSRHEVDKRASGFNSGEEGFPSPGRVAWDLWGGDGGQTWAARKRDQIMKDRE